MKNIGSVALILLLCWGCRAEPKSTVVSVNLDQIKVPAPAGDQPATEEATFQRSAIPKPSLSAQSPGLSRSASRMLRGDYAKSLQEDRERSLNELVKRLSDAYIDEIEVAREVQRARIGEKIQRELQAATKKIRPELESRAEERAKQLLVISYLSNFPDPNPAGGKPNSREAQLSQERKESLAKARRRLAEIDAEIDQFLRKLLDQVKGDEARQLAEVNQIFAQSKKAASERAESEAKKLVGESSFAPDFVLDRLLVTSPRLAPLRASEVPTPNLEIPSPKLTSGAGSKADKAELLKIWLASSGYKLAKDGEASSDATKEFQRWIDSYHLGP